ncbi:uncharacterized protein LOC122036992 isoform X3 [Zingiber officinale]|uniref:uncharacterized protein LOC122036992 isoform X3 n=1 Tax=Zingiber officinale TaxID=94328 RepID=UPI001C4B75CE|nr:uncharacterized protein LOC122036992 isoform X3 [Zingiber officinale]
MGSRNEKGNDEPWKERERATRAWHVALFGLVGVTATGLLAGQLRKTTEWVYTQLSRLRSTSTWSNSTSSSRHEGSRQEAWKRYYRIRMQEEYEDERERVERIRQMQSVFNRGRNKHKTYRSWTDNDPGKYQYIPREDWYYETSTSRSDHKSSYKSTPNYRGHYTMSHHYTVLGLDRTRAEPYTDAEVKSAFRTKAMEHHPDQNQENRVAAEAKFKEIMISYEAIKLERENQKC